MSRRIAIVLLLATAAAIAARLASPTAARPAQPSRALSCGIERWTVKTLQDRPPLLRARATTVAHLASLTRPTSVPTTRLPLERQIYSVLARVTLVRSEADNDLHLVLRSGSSHMIAEAPRAPFCTAHATAYRKKQMRAARGLVRLCARARVVGVAFFDFDHGQTGVAPNAIELHPILGFGCLPSKHPPPPPPPGPTSGKCVASYPTVCIPSPPPDLDCAEIAFRNFRVRWDVVDPDPHRFDGNRDGVGCET